MPRRKELGRGTGTILSSQYGSQSYAGVRKVALGWVGGDALGARSWLDWEFPGKGNSPKDACCVLDKGKEQGETQLLEWNSVAGDWPSKSEVLGSYMLFCKK